MQSQYILRPLEAQSGYVVRPYPMDALTAPRRGLSAYAVYDPNSILEAADQEGNYLGLTLTNVAVASGLPSSGVTYSAPTKNLGGQLADADITNLLTAVTLWAGHNDPPSADVRLMAGLCDGPVETATFGFGVALTASGADWIVSHQVFPLAGAWGNTAAAAASANTRGARASARHVNNSTQRNVGACALDGSNASFSGNSSTNPAATAVADNLDYFYIGAGWATGAGGTDHTQVLLNGFESFLRQNAITGTGRP